MGVCGNVLISSDRIEAVWTYPSRQDPTHPSVGTNPFLPTNVSPSCSPNDNSATPTTTDPIDDVLSLNFPLAFSDKSAGRGSVPSTAGDSCSSVGWSSFSNSPLSLTVDMGRGVVRATGDAGVE